MIITFFSSSELSSFGVDVDNKTPTIQIPERTCFNSTEKCNPSVSIVKISVDKTSSLPYEFSMKWFNIAKKIKNHFQNILNDIEKCPNKKSNDINLGTTYDAI